MLKVRVMPCLLLQDGELVKTIKFKNPSYVGDPVNAIKIFNEKEVDELVLLDIAATRGNKAISFDLIKELASECFMPLAYGGGIRRKEDVKRLFSLGIEKVIINTWALEDPFFIKRIADDFGSQSVVVSIDVKKNLWGNYYVNSDCVRKAYKIPAVEHARKMEECGAGELLINSIDKDGTWDGYEINLLQKITSSVNIPVIACGGAGNLEHMKQAVFCGGVSAVAAGSMVVYQKKGMGVLINFPERKELERALNE